MRCDVEEEANKAWSVQRSVPYIDRLVPHIGSQWAWMLKPLSALLCAAPRALCCSVGAVEQRPK